MGTTKVAEAPWVGVVIVVAVVLLAVGMAIVPGLLSGAWFCGVVVVGIAARTLWPWATLILTTMAEGKVFPTFEAQFYVPLVGALGLDLLAMLTYLLATRNAFMELSALSLSLAFLAGYGGPQVIRDGQKFLRAAMS